MVPTKPGPTCHRATREPNRVAATPKAYIYASHPAPRLKPSQIGGSEKKQKKNPVSSRLLPPPRFPLQKKPRLVSSLFFLLEIVCEGFDLETDKGSPRECMAVRLLANEVSDLCIGKPAVRSLPLSAAAGDLAAALRRGPQQAAGGAAACVAVVGPGAPSREARLADVLCFLCAAPGALAHPTAALSKPASALLPKDGAGEVRRVDPRAR